MRKLVLLFNLLLACAVSHAGEPAHFVSRSLQLHGRTYRYQVFVPDGWTSRQAWPVVLFLHGSGERVCGGVHHPNDSDRLHVEGIPTDVADPHAWVAAHIGDLPTWIFNRAIDDLVRPAESHHMHAALPARGDEVRYTEFPGVGHGA